MWLWFLSFTITPNQPKSLLRTGNAPTLHWNPKEVMDVKIGLSGQLKVHLLACSGAFYRTDFISGRRFRGTLNHSEHYWCLVSWIKITIWMELTYSVTEMWKRQHLKLSYREKAPEPVILTNTTFFTPTLQLFVHWPQNSALVAQVDRSSFVSSSDRSVSAIIFLSNSWPCSSETKLFY